MGRKSWIWVLVLLAAILASVVCSGDGVQGYLTSDEYTLLNNLFATHLNYFLSSEVITGSGFPVTAYKVGNRARYNWSNVTEWGYALQAWIAAAERDVIEQTEAVEKINTALDTMISLQETPDQNYCGLFYPYYRVIDPDSGADLPSPEHDANLDIPSGDNALLYASLVITQG